MHIYTAMCIYICMYIYVYGERERDVYVYTYIYIYIYIYVYTHTCIYTYMGGSLRCLCNKAIQRIVFAKRHGFGYNFCFAP